MYKIIIHFIAISVLVSMGSFHTAAQSIAAAQRGEKHPCRIAAAQNEGKEEQRPVLSVTPREIDLGAIKPDEAAFGEFSLRNLSQGVSAEMEWSASCPEGWNNTGVRTLKGKVSGQPEYLRVEVLVKGNNENYFWEQPKISTYHTIIKLVSAGAEITCHKDLKAGAQRNAIKLTSIGGQRTVFTDFRIHVLQEVPSIDLNPQRLDLGVQLPGKIISRKIELTNKGKETLRWSAIVPEAGSVDYLKELQKERYLSFYNEDMQDQGKYIVPMHLKDSMVLIGKWTEKNGYPLSIGNAGSIKFQFQGTGISVFLQSHTEEGNCSIYLDEELLTLPDALSGQWEKKELVIAEGLTDGPHSVTIVIREGSLELEGVKIFGKEIKRGPRGWVTVFPNSGTTRNEKDYINVKIDTSYLAPGYYSEKIIFKTNVGKKIAEVHADVLSDSGHRVVDVYLYAKNMDYLFTADPQAESKRLLQNGYVKQGIAFRLFLPQTAGTTSFYRWYNPEIKDHFYHHDRTGGGKKLNGYVYEGIIGNIATSRLTNTRELYRWFNPSTKKHYYSTNPSGAAVTRRGYRFEGIAGYVR